RLKTRCRLKRSAAAFSPPTRPLFVIPAQAGIRNPAAAVIPAQAGIQSVRFQSFPINSCRVWGSRFPLSWE
ncbi:TPA: hypothetical protein ACLA7V_000414, partial [Neisseria meningitidis]